MTAALTVHKEAPGLKALLMKALPSVAGIASERLDPERLMRVALVAASRNPKLAECTPHSILSSLMQAASVGLEPETPLGHAYLVPRKNNKTNVMEATFLPSYKGLQLLATRSGDLRAAWSRVVYEGERFEHEEGMTPRLVHVPNYDDENRGPVRLIYAIAQMKDGLTLPPVIMTRKQIEAVRARAQAIKGPWETDWEEMGKKTVLRRLLKSIPTENEKLAKALEADSGDRHDFSDALEAIPEAPALPPASKAEELKRELAEKKAKSDPPKNADDHEAAQAEKALGGREPGAEG